MSYCTGTVAAHRRPTMSIILGERLVRGRIASIVAFAALLGAAQPAAAQFNEQGPKLVGTGPVGFAGQGWSVAVSADGNTAIVGGPEDNTNVGAAWVYTRSGGVWTQQGSKLTAIDAVGAANQGNAVALSADGNTAIVGGYSDNSSAGAAWIFTRSGGVWTQQGAKLVGTGAAGTQSLQGYAVALSADGNTALVGGPHDSSGVIGVPQGIGAAWVYTRSGGVWTQQGAKLIGSGAAPGNLAAEQGWSVALSADGNTALVGGPDDNPNGQGASVGATWVFTRSGGAWTQQGAKLIGTGAIGDANQGWSVALSGDGNTAIVGGPVDNTDGNNDSIGAAWIYTQSGGVWTQQGAKLVGSGVSSAADQGWSVALSADGNTALVGGFAFQPSGATWVFTRSGGAWTQQGAKPGRQRRKLCRARLVRRAVRRWQHRPRRRKTGQLRPRGGICLRPILEHADRDPRLRRGAACRHVQDVHRAGGHQHLYGQLR
jgi:hypothetical protein